MDQEFHERFPHKLSGCRVRSDHVQHAVKREEHSNSDSYHDFLRTCLPAKTWNTFVPNRRQKLLYVRMSHELYSQKKVSSNSTEVS